MSKDWILKVVAFPLLAAFLSALAHQLGDGVLDKHDLIVAAQTALGLLVGVFIRTPQKPA